MFFTPEFDTISAAHSPITNTPRLAHTLTPDPVPTLDQLNTMSGDNARDFFLSCCGSTRWAAALAGCRPYWNIQVVFNAAEVIWHCLGDDDRREALRERTFEGGEALPAAVIDDLGYYRSKFGYEFVAPPPLPPPGELQEAIRRRLGYAARAEFDLSVREELLLMRDRLRGRLTA